jgi:hypothetical protein
MKACSVLRVDPSTSQGVPRSMTQHVRMDREWQLSSHAKPLNKLLGAVDGERRLTLGQE